MKQRFFSPRFLVGGIVLAVLVLIIVFHARAFVKVASDRAEIRAKGITFLCSSQDRRWSVENVRDLEKKAEIIQKTDFIEGDEDRWAFNSPEISEEILKRFSFQKSRGRFALSPNGKYFARLSGKPTYLGFFHPKDLTIYDLTTNEPVYARRLFGSVFPTFIGYIAVNDDLTRLIMRDDRRGLRAYDLKNRRFLETPLESKSYELRDALQKLLDEENSIPKE